jgi:transposase-like protein
VVAVMTLLSYGCPLQAIVAAFDLDERTVARWQRESGAQCRRVHEHLVEAGKAALLQVQADEIRVKVVGGVFWLASAMEVRSRLWLGSVISQHRNGHLIGGLLMRVRRCGSVEKIQLVTEGLSSYKSQALKVFREALHTGKVGRPRLVLAEGVMIARVIKRYQRRRVVEVMRRVVAGSEAEVISRVIATQRSMRALINTAYSSSACRPPSAPGWLLWCVGAAPGHTRVVR